MASSSSTAFTRRAALGGALLLAIAGSPYVMAAPVDTIMASASGLSSAPVETYYTSTVAAAAMATESPASTTTTAPYETTYLVETSSGLPASTPTEEATATGASARADGALSSIPIIPPDTDKLLWGLATATAESIGNGSPSDVLKFAFETVLGVFGLGPTEATDPVPQFIQDVNQRLANVEADIAKVQDTVQQVMQVTTEISMGLSDLTLNEILNAMVEPTSIINRAFSDFVTYTSTIADAKATPASKQQAFTQLHHLLTDDPVNGPAQLRNAISAYQGHVLGVGGSHGVLFYVPMMVNTAWEQCAMNVNSPQNSMEYFGNFYMQQQLGLSGKWYNSVGWIMGECVTKTFSTLTDSTGRSVQSVFASILVTQLKAYTLLNAAWGSDPLKANGLQDIATSINAIGNQMTELWTTMTVPADVNNYGLTLLKRYAGSTFTPYLSDYFWEFSMQGYNDRNSVANPPGFTLRPATITPSMITTMCVLSDTDSQSFYMMDSQHGGVPCLVDPNAIDWSQLTNAGLAVQNDRSMYVNMPATLLGITRANPADKKPEFAYQTITDHMLFAPIGAVPLLPDQVVDGFGSDNIAPNLILALFNAYKGTNYLFNY